jgi:hypothetical protein
MKIDGGKLAGGNPSKPRVENDFYATNPETVKKFLLALEKDTLITEIFNGAAVWECACGNGNIIETLKRCLNSKNVSADYLASDLVNRGCGIVLDFLHTYRKADVIITNPPFSLMNEFIKHGLEQTNRFLIFFAKIQLLETKARAELLKNSPLRYVYIHSERQETWRDGKPLDENGKKWSTTLCMAWFIWDKEYKGEPVVRFI